MINRLLPVLASLLAATLRDRWIGVALPKRCIIMFWHGKMFAGWNKARGKRPIALVSKSKDGEILASVLRAWGYKLARGSSSKEGKEALRVSIEAVRQSAADRLVITPDGPRGPYHKFKRGAFTAARELELPLFMLNIRYSSSITFVKSWDKFELPRPFSRVTIEVVPIDVSGYPEIREAQREWLDELSARISR